MAFELGFEGKGVDEQLSLPASSSPAAYQQPAQAFNEEQLFAFSNLQRISHWPFRANIRQSCTRSSCKKTVLALMASLAAILMLITLCGFARKKKKQQNFFRVSVISVRKLSEEDKAASSGLPEVCGDTQKNTKADEESGAATSSGGGVDPHAKKRKRKESESEGGEDIVGLSGASPPFEGKRKATAKRKHLESKPADDAGEAPGWEGISKQAVQLSPSSDVEAGITVPQEFTVLTSPAKRPSTENEAAHALLLLQQRPSIFTKPAEESAQQEELEPQPSTSAAMSRQPLPAEQKSHEAQERPLASAAQPPPMSAEELANHPFCRMPPLQPGVVVRAFSLENASSRGFVPSHPRDLLRGVRELLAKESLCQQDADLLILLAEGLAAHCHYCERTPLATRHIDQAAGILGMRFLMFDAIIAAFTATNQQPLASWWQQFAGLVPHDISHTPQGKQDKSPRESYYGHLSRRLSRALETLKKGFRLSKEEVYELKYKLFCTDRYPQRFRGAFFDPWRRDCAGSGKDS